MIAYWDCERQEIATMEDTMTTPETRIEEAKAQAACEHEFPIGSKEKTMRHRESAYCTCPECTLCSETDALRVACVIIWSIVIVLCLYTALAAWIWW